METEARAERTLTTAQYKQFLPLVRRTAIRLARRVPAHITVQDLVSYGWVGLLEAFRRSSAAMSDEEFEAYALYRIRGAMLDFLRSLDPATRNVRSQSRKITRAITALTSAHGRPPEESEIAVALDMTAEGYRSLLSNIAAQGMARLEMLDMDRVDVEDRAEGADDALARHSLTSAVTASIGLLSERLQHVLALYYQEECTFREIGSLLGVTESRACQLHTEAVHRLRAAIGRE